MKQKVRASIELFQTSELHLRRKEGAETAEICAGHRLCATNAARLAVKAALPQLQHLDGVRLPRGGQRARPQLAAVQLAAIPPPQVGHVSSAVGTLAVDEGSKALHRSV